MKIVCYQIFMANEKARKPPKKRWKSRWERGLTCVPWKFKWEGGQRCLEIQVGGGQKCCHPWGGGGGVDFFWNNPMRNKIMVCLRGTDQIY